MTTPSANSWINTFNGHNQDDVLDRFRGILNGGSTAERTNHACANAAVAFLLPQPDASVKLLHHLHHDRGDPSTRDLTNYGDSLAVTASPPP